MAGKTAETLGSNFFGGHPDHSAVPKPIDLLTSLPIPYLQVEQLQQFSKESIMARPIEHFSTSEAMDAIRSQEGKPIVSIDFGGDKAAEIIWTVSDGSLIPEEAAIIVKKEDGGKNYLPFFETIAEAAKQSGMDVAISFGGPLDGTKPISIPNAPELFAAMQRKYDGDFANLFPTLQAVNNDAQAGIKAAALAVQRELINTGRLDPDGSIMFPINGGGFGLALLIHGQIIATEVGHVPVIDILNQYRQQKPCGMLGRPYVCIERVAASGAGIESIWLQQTGLDVRGKEINETYYQHGNRLAHDLYENSAVLIAHGLIATASLEGLLKQPMDTAIVYHGGGFRVPGLSERITQIVGRQRYIPPTLMTDTISKNACAEGAVIAALYSPIRT